jgi:DNA-binding NarL/FixJ family response regulator
MSSISNPEGKFRHCEVLIAAESLGDAHLLQALLQTTGLDSLRYTLTARIAEARDWLENDVPDAVLLDLGHADWQGLARLDALSSVAKRAPIVVIADQDDPWLRGQAVRRGALDFLPKQALEPRQFAHSVGLALELSLLMSQRDRVCRVDESPPPDAREREAAFDEPASIGLILDEVCRSVHDRFRTDVHMIVDMQDGASHAPADEILARQSLEHLLLGLCATSRDSKTQGLDLHLRTGGANHSVVISVDALANERREAYRALVLGLLVGQRRDPSTDPNLSEASVMIHELGGSLRSRSCEDGRLWLQVDLPKVAVARGVAHIG